MLTNLGGDRSSSLEGKLHCFALPASQHWHGGIWFSWGWFSGLDSSEECWPPSHASCLVLTAVVWSQSQQLEPQLPVQLEVSWLKSILSLGGTVNVWLSKWSVRAQRGGCFFSLLNDSVSHRMNAVIKPFQLKLAKVDSLLCNWTLTDTTFHS